MHDSKVWFWVLLDAFIAALIIAVLGIGVPVAYQYAVSLTPARTVTVTAEGKTTATPDLAEISFSVVSAGKDPQSLTESNVSKMNAAVQFLQSQAIATSDIATTGYNLQPSYNYDNATQRNYITGYTLTQTVQVKIHDLTKVASVLAGLTPLGVNQVGSVDFTFANQDDYTAIARSDAMNKAAQKAQQMAYAAGARLGGVVTVSESVLLPYAAKSYANMALGMGSAAGAPVPDLQPGSQDITDDVTITYALH